MLYVTNFKGIEGKKNSFDEIWACVRSLKGQHPGIIQVADLSPSTELFISYLSAKNAGKFDQQWFQNHYVPTFLQQMKECKNSRDLLNNLYKADRAGKRIALLCFCQDEELCHRSILAGLLQGVNCDVHGVHHDYSRYYDQYRAL